MTTEFASVPSTYTAARTLNYIRRVERSRETVYAIYVVDPLARSKGRATAIGFKTS